MIRGRAAATLAAALCAAPAAAAEADDLRALRTRIEALRGELSATEGRRDEAVDALRASEQAISEANRTLAELAREQRAARTDQARLATEARLASAALDARSGDLGRLLYRRYTVGEPSALRVLLSGEDASRTARQLAYLGYLARAQVEFLAALRRDLARLDELERLAGEQADALAALAEAAARERKVLEREQVARRRALDRVAGDLRRQRAEVDRLRRDEARLAKLAEDLARTLQGAPAPLRRAPSATSGDDAQPERGAPEQPFAEMKGRLRLPVRGELRGRFGTPPAGQPGGGKGVFIAAREGEEVRAVAAGRVVFADWMRGFGNLLILDHGQGYMTIYGNNEAVLKRLGDAVHGGDTVATVGATGGAETSGLYFEIRHQGRAFDPLPWIAAK